MTLTKLRLIFLWLPVILYAGFIFYLSSISQPPGRYFFPQQDKIIHIAEYLVFALLLTRAIKNTYRLSDFRLFLVVVLLTLLYGLSDEFHQMFVPMRTSEMADAIADGLGGILGAGLIIKKNDRNKTF